MSNAFYSFFACFDFFSIFVDTTSEIIPTIIARAPNTTPLIPFSVAICCPCDESKAICVKTIAKRAETRLQLLRANIIGSEDFRSLKML